jgi:hypothetical protein
MLKMDDRRPMSDVMGTIGSGSVRLQSGSHHAAKDETVGEVSPELALIDDALAARARAVLPEPEDTIDRLWRSAATSRVKAPPAVAAARATFPDASSPPPRRGRIRRRVLVGATVLAVAALGLGFGVRIDFAGGDGARAVASVSVPGPATTVPVSDDDVSAGDASRSRVAGAAKRARKADVGNTSKAGKRAKSNRAKAPVSRPSADPVAVGRDGAVPRRFAWAPVPRATGYYVEFFRGDTRVYASSTESPEVTLPTRWRFRGRVHTLLPGDYRWYVWPVFEDGDRAPAASVQARLRVGDSPA